MSRKRKRGRKRIAKFTKFYAYNYQDDFFLHHERLLQNIHSRLANEIFFDVPNNFWGDWTIKIDGVKLYIDPVFGAQCEIEGTSNLSLSKRLKIHIKLLRLIRKGSSLLKAVEQCNLILKTQ